MRQKSLQEHTASLRGLRVDRMPSAGAPVNPAASPISQVISHLGDGFCAHARTVQFILPQWFLKPSLAGSSYLP